MKCQDKSSRLHSDKVQNSSASGGNSACELLSYPGACQLLSRFFSEENLKDHICQISHGILSAVNCADLFQLSKYIWHGSWNRCRYLLKLPVVHCHRRAIWFSVKAKKFEEGYSGFTSPASFKSLSSDANPCDSSQEVLLVLICSLGWGGVFSGASTWFFLPQWFHRSGNQHKS